MTGEELGSGNHVVRYARPTLVRQDGKVDGGAFKLRPREKYLSVNWLECFEGYSESRRLEEVVQLSRLTMSPNGSLAKLHVGSTMQYVSRALSGICVVHYPLEAGGGYDADPSHSGIVNLPPPDSPQAEYIGDLIAECVTDAFPVRRIGAIGRGEA